MAKMKDLSEVKKLLSKLDSKVLMIALTEMETNRKEIDEIKEFLKSKDSYSIQTALYELNHTVDKSEVDRTIEIIRDIDKVTLKTALRESGFNEDLSRCDYPIKCHGPSIRVMNWPNCPSRIYSRPIDIDFERNFDPRLGKVAGSEIKDSK